MAEMMKRFIESGGDIDAPSGSDPRRRPPEDSRDFRDARPDFREGDDFRDAPPDFREEDFRDGNFRPEDFDRRDDFGGPEDFRGDEFPDDRGFGDENIIDDTGFAVGNAILDVGNYLFGGEKQ